MVSVDTHYEGTCNEMNQGSIVGEEEDEKKKEMEEAKEPQAKENAIKAVVDGGDKLVRSNSKQYTHTDEFPTTMEEKVAEQMSALRDILWSRTGLPANPAPAGHTPMYDVEDAYDFNSNSNGSDDSDTEYDSESDENYATYQPTYATSTLCASEQEMERKLRRDLQILRSHWEEAGLSGASAGTSLPEVGGNLS